MLLPTSYPGSRGFGENVVPFPACAFCLFVVVLGGGEWRLARVHYFHYLNNDQSTVAQPAEMTVAELLPDLVIL